MAYGSLNYLPIFTTGSGQAFRLIKASGTVHYYGFAKPGSTEAAAAWQIQKCTVDGDGDITKIEYPNGSATYGYVWSSYNGYTYI
jgi:hypothetical protein